MVLPPLVWGFQVCRNVFILILGFVSSGAAASISISVTNAHVGHILFGFRYVLSHIISMALFLEDMSRRLRLPSSIGQYRVSRAIFGMELSFHIKFLIIFVSADSMWLDIPWAMAKYCVYPPIITWTISFLPRSVGCDLFHLSRLLWALLMIGSQSVMPFVLFPIYTPSIWVASPSSAILICLSIPSWSWGFSLLVVITWLRWAGVPIGIILVFSLFNFAPDAWHHSSRMLWGSSILSFWLRYMLVSSAKRLVVTGWWES